MNSRNIYSILLLSIGLAAYGCGSNGSSTMEMTNNNRQTNNALSGVSLMGSKQGQAGGFVDLDGNGNSYKVVGAPYATKSSNTGAVLIYKGDGMGGYSSAPTTVLTGDDNLGFSFVKLEKGANDSGEQFAVGAIHGSGDGPNDTSLCGTVSIYKAGSSGPQLVAKLAGEGPMDKFGYSLAAGDLNGDGYTDIVVGAPFNTNDPASYQGGAVYVFFGPTFATKVAVYASTASTGNKGLGWAVAAGDINNDGKSDLLIAGSWPSSPTKTYQEVLGFYGGTSFSPSIDSPDVKVYSSATGFGKTITPLSDLNADGYGEIAIGAPTATANGYSNAGSVYIVKGGTGSRTVNLDANPVPVDQIVRIDGINLFDRFGSAITAVPDMDGDTKPELVVGATTANFDYNYLSGKVYLFKSSSLNLTQKTWTASSVFNGTTKDQSYGYFLASAGGNRLLMGAPRSNMDTGGVSMIDMSTGEMVAGGSSGGGSGTGGDCH